MNVNVSVILNALGMGMAVAGVVLLLLDAVTPQDTMLLLGIGLFCVATDALRRSSRVDDATPSGSKKSSRRSRRK